MSNRDYPWLERLTGAVLLLVFAALGWMVLASWQPKWAEWGEWANTERQVWGVLALLGAALVLVSITALLHTHSEPS
jgi:hypothetical protein